MSLNFKMRDSRIREYRRSCLTVRYHELKVKTQYGRTPIRQRHQRVITRQPGFQSIESQLKVIFKGATNSEALSPKGKNPAESHPSLRSLVSKS